MTTERDQALSRAAEWLDWAYRWTTNARGNVELPDGVISQVPGARHVVREERSEGFRELLLQLQDRVIPDLEAALPDSIEAFTELGDRMRALGIAIYGPWNEFDAAVGKCRAAWREADQAVRRKSVTASPQETPAKSSGPRVPATPKSASSRPKREDYECPQCFIAFEPSRTDQKYCSPACKTASYKERKKSEAESR